MHQRPFLSKVLLLNFDIVMAMSQSPSKALSSEMQLHKYEVIMAVSKSIIKQNAVAQIWSDYGRYPQQGNDQKEWLISSPVCFTDTICYNCKLVWPTDVSVTDVFIVCVSQKPSTVMNWQGWLIPQTREMVALSSDFHTLFWSNVSTMSAMSWQKNWRNSWT